MLRFWASKKSNTKINQSIQLVRFLPAFDEVKILDPSDAEGNYIFKVAFDALQSSESESNGFEEVSYLIQSLADRTWEQINSGMFKDVPIPTRKVYAMACFLKIVFMLHDSETDAQVEECFRVLDNAMLVGCTEQLFSNWEAFVEEASRLLNEKLGKPPDKLLPLIEPIKYDNNAECDIDRLDCPSIELFIREYYALQKPALLRNTINHWPALTKWRDPNYLLRIAGNRFVPIEIGSNYTTDDWSQEMSKFKEFLSRQFGPENTENEIEYLAQHELFDQISTLKEDIRIPDYCCGGADEMQSVDIKAWLGPKGTISPMHQDPKHNILCQVFGSKRIILASPADSEFVYAHKSKMLENTSEIDAENVDFEKYPLAKKAKFYFLQLQEGDAVYIPPKWWHYVRSLSKSFSVSFWWE